jgi:hypothetical protein
MELTEKQKEAIVRASINPVGQRIIASAIVSKQLLAMGLVHEIHSNMPYKEHELTERGRLLAQMIELHAQQIKDFLNGK